MEPRNGLTQIQKQKASKVTILYIIFTHNCQFTHTVLKSLAVKSEIWQLKACSLKGSAPSDILTLNPGEVNGEADLSLRSPETSQLN